MLKTTRFCLASVLIGSLAAESNAQNQTRDGMMMGGVTGALIGGVIGHQNKETTEGALIGGAVGAIAGGVIGNQKQQQMERQRYYQSQFYPSYHEHHTYVTPAPVPQHRVVARRPVTTAEVINMTRSGVSDTVIVAHIQSNGVAMRPDVNDVILMNQEGVSDYVITSMQQGGTVTRVTPSSPTKVYRTYSQPVVIQEEVHVYPRPTYLARSVYTQSYYVERRGF